MNARSSWRTASIQSAKSDPHNRNYHVQSVLSFAMQEAMEELLEFQRRFIATLVGTPAADVELDRHPAVEIHRRTVFSDLTKALAG